MDWLKEHLLLAGAVLLGSALTLVGVVLNGMRTAIQDRARSWTDRRLDDIQRRTKERAKRRESSKKAKSAAKEIERVKAERIGCIFRERNSKDDPGTLWEVVALDRNFPLRKVTLQRLRTKGDDSQTESFSNRVSIEWQALMKPASEQRHTTARLEAHSDDDNDGYCMWELADENLDSIEEN